MHRPRPVRARNPFILLLVSLAACDGGPGGRIARPEELELSIVHGRGMRVTVRDPATPPGDPGLAPAVVARVGLTVEAGRPGEPGATEPGGLRLPAVEVHWHVVEPWCAAEHSVTPVQGDSASNHLRRPTATMNCHLVAEGVVDGRVFDVDTAVATFEAGPAVTFHPPQYLLMPPNGNVSLGSLVAAPEDAYGNLLSQTPPYTAVLTSGQPVITVQDTLLRTGAAEAAGNLRMTVGATTADITVWVIRNMQTHWWHVTWACYGLQLPGGARVDSAHYRMDANLTRYGILDERGWHVGMRGTLTQRTWVQGQPEQETFLVTSRYASQRPNGLVWHNGQPAVATGVAQRYDGGNLCEPPPEGGGWERFAPARAVRGDSIAPDLAAR